MTSSLVHQSRIDLRWRILSFLLLIASLICCIRSDDHLLHFADEEEACCLLEWQDLIVLSEGKKVAPASAIKFGKKSLFNWFLVVDHKNHRDFGIDSDALSQDVYIFPETFLQGTRSTKEYKNIKVLSNPNDCGIKWIDAGPLSSLEETQDVNLPAWGKHYFAKKVKEVLDESNNTKIQLESIGIFYYEKYVRSVLIGYYGMDLDSKKASFQNFDEKIGFGNIHILGIDCALTTMKHLKSELYDFKLYDPLDPHNQKDQKTLAETEVINNSDTDQSVSVELDAEIKSSLEMRHENRIQEVSTTQWNIKASASLSFVKQMFTVEASGSIGYERSDMRDVFASTGTVKLSSKETSYKFYQNVTCKAHTKTVVRIVTKQIDRNQKYIAYYRISPNKNVKMKKEKIRALLRRVASANSPIDVKEDSGGKATFLYTTEGVMNIAAGFDTKAVIISQSHGAKAGHFVYEQRANLFPE